MATLAELNAHMADLVRQEQQAHNNLQAIHGAKQFCQGLIDKAKEAEVRAKDAEPKKKKGHKAA